MKTFICSVYLFLSLSFYAITGNSPVDIASNTSNNISTLGYCPDSNGQDTDDDGSDDLCDLDDDNDGIPDQIECPIIPIDFNNFSGGSHFPGESDAILNRYLTGENLPQSIRISAPVSFGGANDISLTAENSGETLRFQDEDHFQTLSGFTTTLEVTDPAAFRFYATDFSSHLNYTDVLEITPINPSANFAWVIVQESNADINISGTDVLEIIGTGNSNFAEFEIQTLGLSEGFTIRFTNLVDSDPTASSPSNLIQFSVSTCPDSDYDGVVDKLDLDSDNDGILDLDEAGHGAEDDDHDGRIDGQEYEFDDNGIFDDLETFPESGVLNYQIGDSESTPDGIYDAYEIDADGDTCFDALEEDINDPDNDGIAGSGIPTVDANGLITSITYENPLKHYWRNPLMGLCLTEICNDGIDNDADDLVDCMDCQDCKDAINCADQDQDGVNNYCDLDDDNDGITDTTEGRCANSIRFIGWSHNKDDPIGQPKGHFKPGFDPVYVSSAEDETNGPGTTIDLIYSNSIVGGVASGSLTESIANDDYLPYIFTTTASWPENIEINTISHYNALELQNQDASFDFSILWSTDGFATSDILLENIHVRPLDIHILDVLPVPPMDLLPATNYEFRVYFYNLKGHTEFGWDDFSLSGCQHTDTDNDGISDFYDLDSDADGCVDAIEGAGNVNILDLLNDTITGGVNSDGIPITAGASGQGIGTAQNSLDLSDLCNPCHVDYHSAVACDDNNPCTAADSMMISLVDGSTCISCVSTVPASCEAGPTSVESCDDGNIFTINDQQTILDCDNSICIPCMGTPVDCSNGTTSIVACDDNNPCTENDVQSVLDSDGTICIPCEGTPIDCNSGSTSVVTCDDGNTFTINDQQTILDCDNSICVPCLGTPLDCSNGTTSIVACDDNNPCTENDVQSILDSDGTICIPCEGTPIDCNSGSTSVVACDDGNIFSINDQQTILDCDNSICVPCLGTPVDCSNGTTSIVACNDNNPCTENDVQSVLDSDGTICIPCEGTPIDCNSGSTSVVACDDGNIFSINDQQTILDCDNSICVPCLGTPVDCSNGTTSIVACNDNNPCTENDVQSVLDSDGTICIPCEGTPIDCNSGSTSVVACDDGNIFSINDQQTILDCDNSICIPCLGTPVDCSNGTTSIVACNDNNPCTENDVQSVLDSDGTICIPCEGTPIDCNSGSTSVVACDDGNIFSINDQQTILDCDNSICVPCLGTPVDCSNGTTSIVACNDNNPCTENDVQSVLDSDGTICIPCEGTPIDCNSGSTSVVACDDGNIFSINDQQTILDCDNSICIPCLGTPVDCSNGTTSIVACNDNNPCTENDVQSVLDSDGTICIPCEGTPIDCNSGSTSVVACDDGNIFSINDQQTILDCDNSICVPCLGTPVDCSNGTTSIVACDDNNPCTENDVQSVLDSDGTICIPCEGTPIDCNSGSTSVVACDDGNVFTINDQQTILDCDNSICVPCLGTPVDCSNGTTTVNSCNDRNPCTINDEEIILDSDGSICVPCRGTLIDCSNGASSIVSCDDGNPCTQNDQMTILECDSSVCIPCQGTAIEIDDPHIEDMVICQNETIPMAEVLNPNSEATYQWYNSNPTIGDAPIYYSNDPVFQPMIDNSIVGSYTFWVIQKIEDCGSAAVPFNLTIDLAPEVDAGMDIDFDCSIGEVMLSGNVPLDEYDVLWNGPDTNMQREILNPIVQIPGIYSMEIFDPVSGCKVTDTVEVLLPNDILANDDYRDLFEGEIHQINVLENDNLENYENFIVRTFDLSSGNIFVNDENIIYYTPEDLGTNRTESFTYEVCSVECPEVCSQALVTLEISSKSIYIPNAFSPNGDGHNDFFYVSGDTESIKEIKKFAVFNRWGAQVFGANNIVINDPQLGWNGFFKGALVSQNVYIYFVEVEFNDGSLVIFSGDVSVFKN